MNDTVVGARGCRWKSKQIAFRIAAIFLGLVPFAFFESTLRIVGWKPHSIASDPFIDFQSVSPLFGADTHNKLMVTASNRLEYFQPESFAIIKPPSEYRIFCIGGSTVQGRPYSIETSFTTWLQLSLQAAEPARQWDVINCGGVSYASYRLVPIVEEMLQHQPDLIVLYSGHNEFLEDRSYQNIKQVPKLVANAFGILSNLKCFQFFHDATSRNPLTNSKLTLPTEVAATLDFQDGLDQYHRDLRWRQDVVTHFEINLRRIIRIANMAGVPIIVVDPAANLRDCPPFKSEPTQDLSSQDVEMAQRLVNQASTIYPSNPTLAIETLQQAVAIDPQRAEIHFQLATFCADANCIAQAKHHFRIALNEDVCPLRMIDPLHDVMIRVAEETGSTVVPVRDQFESLSEGAIPGKSLFFDHVHPTFFGHQVIAGQIIKVLQQCKILVPQDSWQARRDASFEQHWNSLDHVYFERGQQRLEALRIWTQGKANLRVGSIRE